jgi:hypothetical protein
MKFGSSNSNNNGGFAKKSASIGSSNSNNNLMKISESAFTNQQLQVLGPKLVTQQKIKDLESVAMLSPHSRQLTTSSQY